MKCIKFKFFSFIICIITFYYAACFYQPDPTPVEYCEENNVTGTSQSHIMLYVGRLDSEETTFPYDYNYFDFCSAYEFESFFENIVQVMFGEKIRLSTYDITFLKNVNCALLCKKVYNLKNSDDVMKINTLKKGILNNYQHHWFIDNMPVSWCYATEYSSVFCSTGFPMGCYVTPDGSRKGACILNYNFNKPDTFYLFNHVDINIAYQSVEDEFHGFGHKGNRGRILRIKVQPRSIKHQLEQACSINSDVFDIPNNLTADTLTINYTYSISFVKDNTVKWSSRWDYLLTASSDNNLLFNTINSFVVVVILMSFISLIYIRVLHKDLAHNKQAEFKITSQNQKDVGWKLIYGDVFRPPQQIMLLSVLLGSGIQVILTVLTTSFFAYFGFLCPANGRNLLTFGMMSYVCLGVSAGYVSSIMYKAFGGLKWKLNGILASTLCSGFIFLIIIVRNFTLWVKGSTNTASFTILVELLSLWFGLSFLLTFAGAYCGFKKRAINPPVPINNIPRQIPKESVFNRQMLHIICTGILPFICIFYHLFLILNSVWQNQVYNLFGTLILACITFVIACAQTALLQCYFLLRAENYHWWWCSFLASGSTGFYVFLYCTFFFFTKLHISDAASTFIYFSCTILVAILFSLFSGTIGFFTCFWFVRKIYFALKHSELSLPSHTISLISSLSEETSGQSDNISKADLESKEHIEKQNNLKTQFHLKHKDSSSSGCLADEVKGVAVENQK